MLLSPTVNAHVLAYTRLGDIYWTAIHFMLLAIPAVFVFSGWGAALRTRCSRFARGSWFWTVALTAASYAVLTALLTMPLSYIRYVLVTGLLAGPQQLTFGQWFAGEVGMLLLEAVAALLLAWIPYWLLLRSPKAWWLWSAVLLSPMVLLILMLQPFWISPLVTHYVPLRDKALLAQMTEMAERCGVYNAQIVVGGDDYQVAGLGPTKRILIGSDYSAEFTPAELRFLIGHELGHNVNGDNWKAWIALSVGVLAVFFATHVIGTAAIARWQQRFAFTSLSDPASLPLLVFSIFACLMLLTPLQMLWSRQIEHEADRFGLELTHENAAAASMFAGFEQTYLEAPDPGWFALGLRWNHPPAIERIAFAKGYHPWLEGKPLRYGEVCKMPNPGSP